MTDSTTTYAGLDVHLATIQVAIVRGDRLIKEVKLPHDHERVAKELRSHHVDVCCYEAGLTGFGLARYLIAQKIACDVVAPGLVPTRSGDRVKTDRRDARRLAQLLQGGLLEPIWIPTPEIEALRDLTRARDDARSDRMRARQRLGGFLVRHGLRLPLTCWGPGRRRWLSTLVFETPWQQAAFDDYLNVLDINDRRVEDFDRQLSDAALCAPYADVVARLCCLRGISTLTALGLVAEVGDFERFSSPQKLMSYLGLVPSEHSSGEKRRRGAITKAGNTHARRLLVEAAWNSRTRPRKSVVINRRREGHSAKTLARALHCEKRLHQRYARMTARGKAKPTAIVAVARELCGFVWAMATDQPLRSAD
jgi:transposase